MANIDLDKMLEKVQSTQWALADIDWHAPGAERITAEQWPKLKIFMADLMWIEQVGARGFAAMARSAPTETLREIYRYFHAEEQRHANAEMALMKRWGMLDGDTLPEPNSNIRLTIEWLDRYSDSRPFHVLGAVICMLEVALDGALCKFLLDSVDDPICHAAFARINEDESRHLGVGFSVLEMQGYNKSTLELLAMMAPLFNPRLLLGIAVYFHLLNKMRDNLVTLGLPEEKLYQVIRKFEKIGGRTREGRRNPWFQIISRHGRWMVNRRNWLYHLPVDTAVRLTDLIPVQVLPPVATWAKEMTWQPRA